MSVKVNGLVTTVAGSGQSFYRRHKQIERAFCIGRKMNSAVVGFNQSVFVAVVDEMKRRKVAFLPKAVVKKIAKAISSSAIEVEYASVHFQCGLGVANR